MIGAVSKTVVAQPDHRGFESHPLRRAYNFQSNFAGSNAERTTDVKDLKVCARDRSVLAGRSHFLSAFPSLYVLLDSYQGIVGHWEQDFDTGSHLLSIFLIVSIVPFCPTTPYPIAPFVIQAQAIQDRKQGFVIWAGFHPQHASNGHVDAHFLDHHAR